MNGVRRIDQPARGTVSNRASRRTFLKGVGLAGGVGLAAPFLSSTSAGAATDTVGDDDCTRAGIILGCNAGIYFDVNDVVPGAVGCRSYRDKVIRVPSDVPQVFPGQPGSKVVASIRPHPDALLSGSLDDAIKAMLRDGVARFSAPQLTVWHEAGNLYTVAVDDEGVEYSTYITPTSVRQMHVKMQDLCNDVGGVGYGCVIYGDISTMDEWIPYSPYTLDWYGIDVYWNAANDFSTYAKLKAYMDDYLTLVRGRTGLRYPKINVCETNTHDESNRPQFFDNVARWLYTNGGDRMLTFFKAGGKSGGAWDPTDQDTIAALNRIVDDFG